MTRNRGSASLAITTALSALSVLSGTLATPIARADPLDPIKARVNEIRTVVPCGPLNYSVELEAAAQRFARPPESPADVHSSSYEGSVVGFLGSGDPEKVALDSTMTKSLSAIEDCAFKDFGVGFVRHDDREVDVVTLVLGQPQVVAAKPPPPLVVTPPVFPVPATPTVTVTADVDVYDAPDGNKIGKFLKKGRVVKVLSPCRSDDWCALADGNFAYGEFLKNN